MRYHRRMKGAIKTIECLACGSQLEFLAGSLSTRCSMCEDERPLPLRLDSDVPSMGTDDAAMRPDAIASHQHFRCGGCHVLLSSTTAPSACPYCAGALSPEPPTSPRIPVHGWLGSLFESGHAKAMLTAELARHSMPDTPARMELVYVPWLLMDVVAHVDYDGEVGHYEKQGEDTVVVWTPRSGRCERHFDNRRHTGSRVLPTDLAKRLDPWDWAFARPFDATGVVSEVCERTDLPASAVFERVMGGYQQDLEDAAMDDIGGAEQRIHSVRPTYTDHTVRSLLVPVWVGKLQSSGKTFAVNGRTGEAVVDGLASIEAEDEDLEITGNSHRVWWAVAVVVLSVVFGAILFGGP